jgi:hypothetical protein
MSETNENESGKRPGFLTTLCILTFIGSGLGVLGGILGLIGSSALATLVPAGSGVVSSVAGLIASGLCLFGAIQMWGLKKQGYMLYLVGCIIAIVMPFVNMFIMPDLGIFEEAAKSSMLTGALTGLAINALFIVLYTQNKKHLR